MTDTEKLGDKFYQIIKEHGKDGKAYQVDLLLQACKQSGLKFVPDDYDVPTVSDFWQDPKDMDSYVYGYHDGGDKTREAIDSQIKEIE